MMPLSIIRLIQFFLCTVLLLMSILALAQNETNSSITPTATQPGPTCISATPLATPTVVP